MADIFKRVFLAPLIGFMIAIPLICLFDCAGFLDNLSVLASAMVGIVAALIGFLIGKMVEYRAT